MILNIKTFANKWILSIRGRVKSVDVDFRLMISTEWAPIPRYVLRDLFRVTNTHCIRSQKIELCQVIVVDRHTHAFQFRERRGFRFRVVKPDRIRIERLSRSRFLRSFLLFLSPPALLLPLTSTFYSIFVRAFLRSSFYRLFSNRRVMGTAGGDHKLNRDCEI